MLSLRDVTVWPRRGRRESPVLDRVSLDIEHGDFVGVWGPTRSGKSTLLSVMAGLREPDCGEARFAGQPLYGLSGGERASLWRGGGVALVRADWRTQIVRPVVDVVAMACASDGVAMPQARVRARSALAGVGAEGCADVSEAELTLGERLRVGLAMALVREPRLLLVDEPAVLPNPLEGQEIYVLLRSLGERGDLAVVVASANLEAIGGVWRTMAVSAGEVRSMDEDGVLVRFPGARSGHAARAGGASSRR